MTTKVVYAAVSTDDAAPKPETPNAQVTEPEDGSSVADRKPRSRFKGWRFGMAMAAAMCMTVLIANIVLTCVAAAKFSGELIAGVGTLMEGDCDAINNWSTGLHVLINILSSLMLSASHYCMQCVVAPTRQELDQAHKKHRWLHIGVPSVRNVLGKIAVSRTILFALLVLSSIPVHLLFNSVIFKTIDANMYDVLVVNDLWLDGQPFNTELAWFLQGKWDHETIFPDNSSMMGIQPGQPGYDIDVDHLRVLQTFFTDNRDNSTAVQRLENADCISKYGSSFVSGRSDVVLVTHYHNSSGDNLFFSWHSDADYRNTVLYNWVCLGDSGTLGQNVQCDVSRAINSARTGDWYVNNKKVEYCLSRVVPPKCRMQFSMQLLVAVIICNMLKTGSILWALFRQRDETIVTIGDAIATFLDKPDTTSRRHAWTPPTTPTARNKRQFWFRGASRDRWGLTVFLCIGALATSAVYLQRGMIWSTNDTGKSIIQRGFGILDPSAIIGYGDPERGSKGLISAVILTNTPQVVASVLYLAYNGLFTGMLMASEWSRFYLRAKPLRTSTPKGQQRSTYWLSLPFVYSIPLLIASTTLHWLISQSLFLARIVVYQDGVPVDPPGQEGSSVAYSCLPILLVIILGVVLLLFALGTGLRQLENKMPVVGSNSLKIAAACHPPRDDKDAAYLPVSWGMVDDETEGRKYTFTSRPTREADIEDFTVSGNIALYSWRDGKMHDAYNVSEITSPPKSFRDDGEHQLIPRRRMSDEFSIESR